LDHGGTILINSKHNPIGIFDSGMGGISVLATLMKELPNETFIYFGDSINAPYGTKSVDEVRQLTIRACDFLVSQNVKAIVVACNTATSAAIKDLRARYTIPVVGMEPALKPAVELNNTGSIAVMATPMTLKESKFEKLMNRYMDAYEIVKVPCPELVQLVEDNHVNDPQIKSAIKKCFESVELRELDSIVLGCTHYVFLKRAMEQVVGSHVKLIDGNLGTARQVLRLLKRLDLLCEKAPTDRDRVSIFNSKSEALTTQSWELLYYILEQ